MNTKQVPLNENLIKALEQDGNRLYKLLDRQRIRDEALAEDLFGNLDDETFGEVYNTVLNADKKMRACVYFIKNEYNGFIKIGQTRNLPKRTKEIKSWFLQCGMEPKIKVVAVFITFPQFLNKMEAYYHKFFKERRGYGEWFQIDEAEITDINNFGDGFTLIKDTLVCFEGYEKLMVKKDIAKYDLSQYVDEAIEDQELGRLFKIYFGISRGYIPSCVFSPHNNTLTLLRKLCAQKMCVKAFRGPKTAIVGFHDSEPITFSGLKRDLFYSDYAYWETVLNH